MPRLRRADAAHRAALRPAGPRLRLPLLRHPQPAERRLRARGHRRRGPDPRARADPGASTAMRERRGRSERARALLRPRQAHRGARRRPRAQRRAARPSRRSSSAARAGRWREVEVVDRPADRDHARRPSCRGASAPPAAAYLSRAAAAAPSAGREPLSRRTTPLAGVGAAAGAAAPARRRGVGSAGRLRAAARPRSARRPRSVVVGATVAGSGGTSCPVAVESSSSASSVGLARVEDRVVGGDDVGRRSAPGRCRRRPARRRTRSPSASTVSAWPTQTQAVISGVAPQNQASPLSSVVPGLAPGRLAVLRALAGSGGDHGREDRRVAVGGDARVDHLLGDDLVLAACAGLVGHRVAVVEAIAVGDLDDPDRAAGARGHRARERACRRPRACCRRAPSPAG